MLSNDELLMAVYRADLKTVEQAFPKDSPFGSPSGLLLNINSLIQRVPAGTMYQANIFSIVCELVALQPEKFSQFQPLLDFVVERDGLERVLYEKPFLVRMENSDRTTIPVKLSPLVQNYWETLESKFYAEGKKKAKQFLPKCPQKTI